MCRFFVCLSLLMLSCVRSGPVITPPPVTVVLQPLGEVDKRLLEDVSDALKKTYGFNVLILAKRPIPTETFINVKSPRYRADKLIAWLKEVKPDSVDHIIGITGKDISITKYDGQGQIKEPVAKYTDWGVFGLGYRPGPSCVVSTYRLRTPDTIRFQARLQKVAIHELGHNLGLPHCPNPGCVMNSANESIKTIDKAKPELCSRCQEKI